MKVELTKKEICILKVKLRGAIRRLNETVDYTVQGRINSEMVAELSCILEKLNAAKCD